MGARARDAVLQSTSSESDQAKDPESEEVSPRKKLKTKKALDEMRRRSGGEEGKSEKQGSSEEDGPTPKSKKKLKLMTSTPKAKKQLSDPESGSGMDLMGIDSDDESALKAKKLKKKKGGKVDQKNISKKKSGEKSGDSFSGGSDMDSDEKAYR